MDEYGSGEVWGRYGGSQIFYARAKPSKASKPYKRNPRVVRAVRTRRLANNNQRSRRPRSGFRTVDVGDRRVPEGRRVPGAPDVTDTSRRRVPTRRYDDDETPPESDGGAQKIERSGAVFGPCRWRTGGFCFVEKCCFFLSRAAFPQKKKKPPRKGLVEKPRRRLFRYDVRLHW